LVKVEGKDGVGDGLLRFTPPCRGRSYYLFTAWRNIYSASPLSLCLVEGASSPAEGALSPPVVVRDEQGKERTWLKTSGHAAWKAGLVGSHLGALGQTKPAGSAKDVTREVRGTPPQPRANLDTVAE
jgi:hypothetical protein